MIILPIEHTTGSIGQCQMSDTYFNACNCITVFYISNIM